jgi:hypothetical protein
MEGLEIGEERLAGKRFRDGNAGAWALERTSGNG